MARYPRTQGKIAELAERVIDGLEKYQADFPHGDSQRVKDALNQFKAVGARLDEAQASVTVLAEEKQAALERLNAAVKQQIKLCQVDCTARPEKLVEIGWGQKDDSTPLQAPGQPTEFLCTAQGDGTVTFSFKKSLDGGRASCFILQRRQSNLQDAKWQMVDFYYDTIITAKDQPEKVLLEYRVIASNPAGQSLPSNVVTVVL